MIPNHPESMRKLMKKLGPAESLRVCYEAGPTGYVLYWQLTQLGVPCEVVAPTLVPVKGGRSRQDGPAGCDETGAVLSRRRSDAGVGARCGARSAARSGACAGGGEEGSVAGPPSTGQISAAARAAAADGDDAVDPASPRRGSGQVRFEQPAQEATRLDYVHEVEHMAERIARLERAIEAAVKAGPGGDASGDRGAAGAARDCADRGRHHRRGSRRALPLRRARQLMGYAGWARASTPAARIRRGGITKTGNAHLRRITIEAAWAYRHRPAVGGALRKRQARSVRRSKRSPGRRNSGCTRATES